MRPRAMISFITCAVPSPISRPITSRMRRADTLQADQRAAVVEALHHLREALALVAEAVAHRHAHVVEEDRAAADDGAADVVEVGARDAWGFAVLALVRNEERADALRS